MVQVIPKPPPNNPNAREFDINYYPKVARSGGQKMTRKLKSATVQFDSESVFKDNLLQAVDWKKAVNIQTKRALRKIFFDADINSLQCMLYDISSIVLTLQNTPVHVHVCGCLCFLYFVYSAVGDIFCLRLLIPLLHLSLSLSLSLSL